MLQVWDNSRVQREEGRFPSFQCVEHPLLIISSVHYGWNLRHAWPQRVGLSVSSRHFAVSHCKGYPSSLSWWQHAPHHYSLGKWQVVLLQRHSADKIRAGNWGAHTRSASFYGATTNIGVALLTRLVPQHFALVIINPSSVSRSDS